MQVTPTQQPEVYQRFTLARFSQAVDRAVFSCTAERNQPHYVLLGIIRLSARFLVQVGGKASRVCCGRTDEAKEKPGTAVFFSHYQILVTPLKIHVAIKGFTGRMMP
jgi:hypothetical protein